MWRKSRDKGDIGAVECGRDVAASGDIGTCVPRKCPGDQLPEVLPEPFPETPGTLGRRAVATPQN